ncbi:MAG: pilus assembly protein [Xanthomonadaceae bacterium]|nr:pilus assembly protein [Xanthomonadaceae bacterium]
MSRRKVYIGSSALLVGAVIGGYLIFGQARQGGGGEELAQSPMNIEAPVPPAFIMALDDSTSMFSETISDSYDGGYVWENKSFYDTAGEPAKLGSARWSSYWLLFPYPYPNKDRPNRWAIPPFAGYGFARSPDINPFYFDPRIDYPSWKTQDGKSYGVGTYGIPSLEIAVRPDAAPVDPRLPSSTGVPPAGYSNLRLNLTQDIRPDPITRDDTFLVFAGMVIPAGTEIYITTTADLTTTNADDNRMKYPCKGGYYSPPELKDLSRGWQTLGSSLILSDRPGISAANGYGFCELGIRYFAPTFYLKSRTVGPHYGYTAAPTAITNPAGGMPGTLWKYEIKRENFGSQQSYDAAIQNFARWFTFYRVRRDALIGGATNALTSVNSMRIGALNITEHTYYYDATNHRLPMYDMRVEADRIKLFDKLTAMNPTGSTPNIQAVQAAGEQFKRTDADAPAQLRCQKNAAMLLTDGFSNDYGNINVGNVDGSLGAPFADTHSDTLADVVAKYYTQNLRADLPANQGSVPVPDECRLTPVDKRLDCQKDPHMNFHAIALGANGKIFGDGRDYHPVDGDYSNIDPDPYAAGHYPQWNVEDQKPQNGIATAVDDIWHATLTGRGLMINAKRPEQIAAAMNNILGNVGGGTTTAGTLGLTGARIGTGSFTVEPTYVSANSSTDWYSYLRGYKIVRDVYTGKLTNTLAWEASGKLAGMNSSERNIWFAKPSGNAHPNVNEFNASNVSSLDALCTDPLARCASAINGLGVTVAEAVAYLRGSRNKEPTPLRYRTTLLGDIVNSSPVISAARDDYGYRSLRTVNAGVTVVDPYGYAGYLSDKSATRTSSMVFVGANDGMLHAFDENGVEKFAYIPQTSLTHMGNLLFPYSVSRLDEQVFQHRYYVDGPVSLSDVRIGNAWKTMLVGTSGAGGRSVFALDVSNPGSFSASNVSWEISDNDSDEAIGKNIGYVLGKPVIVPVSVGGNPSWKAIFGNGYNSENKKAALFIVDMGTGATSVVEAEESAMADQPNGLGNIVVVDRYIGSTSTPGADGYADTVYAADQNGAIWKFDIGSATPSVRGTVFVATDGSDNRQSITGGITATRGASGGVMLYFGTGSYSFENDRADNSVQTFYAVLDREATAQSTLTRADLRQQLIAEEAANGSRTFNYFAGATLGWYVDLMVLSKGTLDGERIVGTPAVNSGIVFFTSYQPVGGGCAGSGINRLYGVNAISGAPAMSSVKIGSPTGSTVASGTGGVTLDTSGSAPVKDIAIMSTPRVSPLTGKPSAAEVAAATAARCSMVVQVAGAPALYLPRPCGRQSWRQIR